MARYKIVTSFLILMFGLIILYRSVVAGASFSFYLLGFSFAGLGAYRFWLLWGFLKSQTPEPPTKG